MGTTLAAAVFLAAGANSLPLLNHQRAQNPPARPIPRPLSVAWDTPGRQSQTLHLSSLRPKDSAVGALRKRPLARHPFAFLGSPAIVSIALLSSFILWLHRRSRPQRPTADKYVLYTEISLAAVASQKVDPVMSKLLSWWHSPLAVEPDLPAPLDPSLVPLSPERLAQATELFGSAMETLENAVVVEDVDSKISIVFGEFTAGVLGAIVSRGLAGGFRTTVGAAAKKGPNFAESVAKAGVYFGVRAFARAGSWVLGVPGPAALVLAPLVGSAASASVKYAARQFGSTNARQLEAQVLLATDQVKAPNVGWEVAEDVCKWIVYDTIISRVPVDGSAGDSVYLIVGAFAAFCGRALGQCSAIRQGTPLREVWASAGFPLTMLEGGILFFTYEESSDFLKAVVPRDIGERTYWFKAALDNTGQALIRILDPIPPRTPDGL